jgi:hypothetical protein
VAESPDPSSFSEYMKRVSHVIALQGIFGILLLATRFLPDESMAVLTRGGETLSLLDLNSLAVFALFLVLTIAIFRQEADGPLGEGDPFRGVVERYGRPSGSTTLFRVVHAIFSVVTILVCLTAVPAGSTAPTLYQEAGIIVLFVIVVFSSPAISLATSRFAERTMGGFRRTFACVIYLLGLGLILGGAVAGIQNLLIAGMVIISLEILYVVIQEDRRIRAGESAREA